MPSPRSASSASHINSYTEPQIFLMMPHCLLLLCFPSWAPVVSSFPVPDCSGLKSELLLLGTFLSYELWLPVPTRPTPNSSPRQKWRLFLWSFHWAPYWLLSQNFVAFTLCRAACQVLYKSCTNPSMLLGPVTNVTPTRAWVMDTFYLQSSSEVCQLLALWPLWACFLICWKKVSVTEIDS